MLRDVIESLPVLVVIGFAIVAAIHIFAAVKGVRAAGELPRPRAEPMSPFELVLLVLSLLGGLALAIFLIVSVESNR